MNQKHETHTERVAANLRRYRKHRNMSVRTMSERIAKLGVTMYSSAISKIELGQRRINVDELFAFASVLSIPVVALLEERSTPSCAACDDLPPPGFACNTCETKGIQE